MNWRALLPLFTSLSLFVAGTPDPATAQQASLTIDDYGRWESLGSPVLSADGRWLAYGISRNNERDELRLRELRTDADWVFPFGGGPGFSKDNRWLAFRFEASSRNGIAGVGTAGVKNEYRPASSMSSKKAKMR